MRNPTLRRGSALVSGTVLMAAVLALVPVMGRMADPLFAQSAPCTTQRDKTAAPETIRLGETVTVRLSLGGHCPQAARKADVVLVIDASYSMNGSGPGGGPAKLAAAKLAAKAFVDQMDPALVQVGVISFNAQSTVEHRLSTDYAAVKRGIDRIQAGAMTNIVDALEDARALAIGRDHRADAGPVIVFLTDGGHTAPNPPFSDIDGVIARVRADRIETYSIGLDGAEAWVLRRIAGEPSRYIETPNAAELSAVYQRIAGLIQATALFERITVEDEIPANMRYLNGSAKPPAFYDAGRRTLVWTMGDVQNAGAALEYRLQPQVVGRWPTNVRATGRYTDGLGHPGQIVFPVPEVTVLKGAPDLCVCRITRQKVPQPAIDAALTHPERIGGWNRLLDAGKPGAPPYPTAGHDRPPNPRRTCLDLRNRGIHYHPLFNSVIWRAGCLEGPAGP